MSTSADRLSRSRPAVVTGTIGLGVAGLLVGFLIAVVGISLAAAVFPSIEQNSAPALAIATAGQGIGIAIVAVGYLRYRGLSWSFLRVRMPTLRDVGWTIGVTIGLFAALFVAVTIIEWLGLSAAEHSVAEAAEDDPLVLLPLVPLSILVTGPAEELLYRGVIQTRLRKIFDAASAVLVASVIFAVVHIPAYATEGLGPELLTTLGILLLLGGFLGAVYEHTGNLLVPAVAHGLYNAIVFGGNIASGLTI
ncbi:MAG: lysostaphin resistance A-like protein [Natronomonas sp.]